MPEQDDRATTVDATPTKAFFVSMLTRDITLVDAILDLVDNSLDGALRQGAADNGYEGFEVRVSLTADQFSILDNCGGIPRDVAAEYAFKMGRDPNDLRDQNVETIGMYGIGMKRAIFKMGKNATVATSHDGDHYKVRISAAWLSDPEWTDLPIEESEALVDPGTSIVIDTLNPGISRQFSSEAFVDELSKALSDHFTVFIQRGFSIFVNGNEVQATKVRVLLDENGPKPYFLQWQDSGTIVTLVVGINPSRQFIESSSEDYATPTENDRQVRTSGVTVFCNDRAVLVGDKTRLTTWGAGNPAFHPQFNVISGIIEFRSSEAQNLPVTTTKRNLDTSSDLWMTGRHALEVALRVFVKYTNRWKNTPRRDQAIHYQNAEALSVAEVRTFMELNQDILQSSRRFPNARVFDPSRAEGADYPLPPQERQANRRIVFSRPRSQVSELGRILFDDADANPGDVGGECFDRVFGNETGSG